MRIVAEDEELLYFSDMRVYESIIRAVLSVIVIRLNRNIFFCDKCDFMRFYVCCNKTGYYGLD